MISDEPDEDADELDDDSMLETYLAPAQGSGAGVTPDLPDWPYAQSSMQGAHFSLDNATVAWFKANYTDWQREIGSVLRGWIAAHSLIQPDIQRLR